MRRALAVLALVVLVVGCLALIPLMILSAAGVLR